MKFSDFRDEVIKKLIKDYNIDIKYYNKHHEDLELLNLTRTERAIVALYCSVKGIKFSLTDTNFDTFKVVIK